METNILTPQDIFIQPVRYDIPDFQRRYIWKKEHQWEPLWEDVTDIALRILENGSYNEKHFLGAVVLQPKPGETGDIKSGIVIDGQQRLTTLQLMMDAVQEVLEANECNAEAKKLRNLIENDEVFIGSDQNYKFKIWPTVFDRDAFQDAMINERDSLVVQAHEFFKAQTQNWLDSESNGSLESGRTAADALGKAIRLRLDIVVIDLGSEDPHLIFETMNARGTPLLQSDMVKNNILYEANILTDNLKGKRLKKSDLWSFDEDPQGYWTQEIGRGFHRRPRIDVFLNHWLTFVNKKLVRQSKEFETFQKYSKNQQDIGKSIEDVANNLSTIGAKYREIDECSISGFEPFLHRCKVMNLGAITPLLLWLLQSKTLQEDPKVLLNCVRVLDSFFVRRAVCGMHARIYANIGERLLRMLYETETAADQILIDYLSTQKSISEMWPDDEQFKERILDAPLYRWLPQNRLCMVLIAIEDHIRSTKKPLIDTISRDMQIEHVMPVAWHTNWPLPEGQLDVEIAAGKRDNAIHTIGNLTLVSSPLNPKLSNKKWKIKKEILEDQEALFINKDLVKLEHWDEQSIRERSLQLYELARIIWPHADQIME